MATVRIYKVAELLDTTSQEVLALLKREHGIELKSASSTLEEVVARSFVERQARQRGITLPKGDMFAEGAVKPKAKAPASKKAAAPAAGGSSSAGGSVNVNLNFTGQAQVKQSGSNLDIKADDKNPGRLTLNAVAKTFRYLDAEEIEAQRKAAADAKKGGAKQ